MKDITCPDKMYHTCSSVNFSFKDMFNKQRWGLLRSIGSSVKDLFSEHFTQIFNRLVVKKRQKHPEIKPSIL